MMTATDKRHEILQAALYLIAEHGFHEAPIAKIAARAGVGAGTIYRYFANKDILINELFRAQHARISSLLLIGYHQEGPVEDRFLHLGTALLHYFIANPLEFRFLEQYLNSPYGIAFRKDRLLGQADDEDFCRRLLEEGRSRQEIKELPLAVLFALAFGPLLAVARDHVTGVVELNEDLIVRTVQACWDSLKR